MHECRHISQFEAWFKSRKAILGSSKRCAHCVYLVTSVNGGTAALIFKNYLIKLGHQYKDIRIHRINDK